MTEAEAPAGKRAPIPLWIWLVLAFFELIVFVAVVLVVVRAQPAPQKAQLEAPKAVPRPFKLGPPPGMFRVAAVQFVSEFGAAPRNRERLAALTRDAAAAGAQIVVFPEAAVPGYMAHDLKTAWRDPIRRNNPKDGRSIEEAGVAEPVPGPSTEYFGALTKELKVYVVVTLLEKVQRDAAADYFNTAVLLGPDGAIRCHYRKLHPWPVGEATWAQPGDRGMGLCETEFGKLGVLICFDLSNGVPEKMKAVGVTTLLYPIGWVCSNSEQWFDHMLPEKAKDWGLNLVGANWSLHEKEAAAADWAGFGWSRIITCDGKVLAKGGPHGEGVIFADLPLPAAKP